MDPDAHTCILTHVYVGLHASMAQQYNNVDYRQWGNNYKQKMVCFFLLFFPFCLITTTDPYIHLTTACVVSQSEGLGWDKQPQPTQQRTMKRQVVVCLRGIRGEITYGEGDASTPKE